MKQLKLFLKFESNFTYRVPNRDRNTTLSVPTTSEKCRDIRKKNRMNTGNRTRRTSGTTRVSRKILGS